MPRVSWNEIPDHGRLWVFPSTETLASRSDRILSVVDAFLDTWAAHGVPLQAARELVEDRFILVAVDVDAEAPSGCSIDALVRMLREVGEREGVSLVDHGRVWFRDAQEIRCVSRAQFRHLVEEGVVDGETRVFDTTLTTVGQWRAGMLERPASETWHARAFLRAGAR